MLRAVLAAALVAPFLAPLAAADETHADCEADQWWIGHGPTRAASLVVEEALAPTPLALKACEGEHWDGQDAVGAPYDPNGEPSSDPLAPAAARASVGDDAPEAYAAANVAFVGRASVYAGACTGGAGLEGDARCRGEGELRVGAYARDNTPGNVVTQLTPRCSLSITGCGLSESDCSHAWYEHTMREGFPTACDRDNTAYGLGLVLA